MAFGVIRYGNGLDGEGAALGIQGGIVDRVAAPLRRPARNTGDRQWEGITRRHVPLWQWVGWEGAALGIQGGIVDRVAAPLRDC